MNIFKKTVSKVFKKEKEVDKPKYVPVAKRQPTITYKEKLDTYVAGSSYRQEEIEKCVKYLFKIDYWTKYDGESAKDMKEWVGIYYEIPPTRVSGWLDYDKENEYNPKALKVMCDDFQLGFIPDDELDKVYELLEQYELDNTFLYFSGGKFREWDEFDEKFIYDSENIKIDVTLEFK